MGLFDDDDEPVAVAEKPKPKPKAEPVAEQPSAPAATAKPATDAIPDWVRRADVLVFDIETGPLPMDYLRSIMPPFDPASLGEHPGYFDPATVKTGNLKDRQKIADKVQAEAEKHAAKVAEYEAKLGGGEDAYWQKIQDDAAKSPITGKVLAVGIGDNQDRTMILHGDDEKDLLDRWWKLTTATKSRLTGWNISNFDIHFLVNRSRINRLEVPVAITDRTGRYLVDRWIEMAIAWKAGAFSPHDPYKGYDSQGISAKNLAKVFGEVRPELPVQAPTFWQFYTSQKKGDRDLALEYLTWDIKEEVSIAKGLGVMQ